MDVIPAAGDALQASGCEQANPSGRRQRLAGRAPLPTKAGRFGYLADPLVRQIMEQLAPAELASCHMVSRAWRDAARLCTRALRFRGRLEPEDTERLKQFFPNVYELSLERMVLTPPNLACVASLARLTVLRMRMCTLKDGASLLALGGLQLQELHLVEVLGPTSEALDDALRRLTTLHTLHVESRSPACKAPSLRSLAVLRKIKKLSVKQAQPQSLLVGLTHLSDLRDLHALDLRGAGLSNDIMRHLAPLSALTQLCIPEAPLVTDTGFQALAGLTALRELDASCRLAHQADEAVSDAGAANLALLSHLSRLSLAGRSAVTAQGLAFVERFTDLQFLDLSRVQLHNGSAAFLWQLPQLTCLHVGDSQMRAAQFEGLSALVLLQELDVSGTQFDDTSCCQLTPLAALRSLNLARTHVTASGIRLVNASHPCRLHQLRLDGCRVSVGAVLSTLHRQPGDVCLWDGSQRGHLPRWVNVWNTVLMSADGEGRRCLRLRYAPEPRWYRQVAMGGAVAGLLALYFLLLLATIVTLLTLPLVCLLGTALMPLAYVVARKVAPASLLSRAQTRLSTVLVGAAARAEVLLSAVLVGVLCMEVPPPPADMPQWHW